MKRKDERKADSGLKQLGITPRVYHFEIPVEPFTAITIACEMMTWQSVREVLNNTLRGLRLYQFEKATRMREELRRRGIWGAAICDHSDNLNRRRGRTIAKGRLLKHTLKLRGRTR